MFQHLKLRNFGTLLLHCRHSPRSWHVFKHKNGVYNIFYLHNTFVFEQLNDFVLKKGLSQTLEQNRQSIWWTCSASSSNYCQINRFGQDSKSLVRIFWIDQSRNENIQTSFVIGQLKECKPMISNLDFGCADGETNCTAKRRLQFNNTIEIIFRCKNCKIELLAP